MNHAAAGEMICYQTLFTNLGSKNLTVVGHQVLPAGWLAIPTNDILVHLDPGQTYIQTFFAQVPKGTRTGQFPAFVEIWSRTNLNTLDRDDVSFIVRNPLIVQEEIKQVRFETPPVKTSPQSFQVKLTSPECIKSNSGETIYISSMVRNEGDEKSSCKFAFDHPQGWQPIPGKEIECEVAPKASHLQVFGLRISPQALAGTYDLGIEIENEKIPLKVEVLPRVSFIGKVQQLDEFYLIGEPCTVNVDCFNEGNVPIRIRVETSGDPICDINMVETIIEIQPLESKTITLFVEPDIHTNPPNQFVFVKMYNADTDERIYQETLNLTIAERNSSKNDPFVRIPSHYSAIALGQTGRYAQTVFAVEFAGEGMLNAEKERYLEFCFRVPTDTHNVIYNIDQRLFVGLSDPDREIKLGDTVYELSPLTQRYRYGRGAGIDIYNDTYSYGAHYTQNTFNNDYNPKQACAFLEMSPSPKVSLATNYLHQNLQHTPTSNLLTLSSEFNLFKDSTTEIEYGQNIVNHVGKRSKQAFRFETRGRFIKDGWYDFEKVYAGSAFYGYYQHLDMFSGAIDVPITSPIRANLSYNRLKQNFDPFWVKQDDEVAPRQRQYNANISYQLSPGSSITLTGLLLRAKDVGFSDSYDFNQKWTGFSYYLGRNSISFNTQVSFGLQKDYLTGTTTAGLQRYYAFIGKDVSKDLYASLFYEGGNTNYYDARPWRTSFGSSMRYRYAPRGWMELFAQRVTSLPENVQMTQISLNVNHTRKNFHNIQLSAQYFFYRDRYPKEFMFLIAYTIPIGVPAGRRTDIGSLSGYVYDDWRQMPAADAVINLDGIRAVTDAHGHFFIPYVATGTKNLKAEILPKNMITKETQSQIVNIRGARQNQINISVVPACSIKGGIKLFATEETLQQGAIQTKLVQIGGLRGTRVVIDRDNGKEIYSAFTDSKGGFSFVNLRPGRWRIVVSTSQLPPLTSFDQNEFYIDMRPEENKEVIIRALPEERIIQPLSYTEVNSKFGLGLTRKLPRLNDHNSVNINNIDRVVII